MVRQPLPEAPPLDDSSLRTSYLVDHGGPLQRFLSFLRSHPKVCLLLLTPGIPEYISSSSPIANLFLNPGAFAFELVANLGLYGSGVILIREAAVRWRRGWTSILLLGVAYGILEEGVALSTLFNPKAGPVGELGYFGHWAGVSWVWLAEILPVHMIFSISIPILLLGVALPYTGGRSLVSRRGIALSLAVLSADVVALLLVTVRYEGFWMGYAVLFGSSMAICILALLARLWPAGRVARTEFPQRRPRTFAILGAAFFPSVLLTGSLAEYFRVPPIIAFIAVVVLQLAFLVSVLRIAGSHNNAPHLVALCLGLILPVAAIGLLGTIRFPVVLAADLVMGLFFLRLWSRYHVPVSGSPEPHKTLSEIG